jgi:hypothetical protein
MLLTSDRPEFDPARAAWNLAVDQRPAAIDNLLDVAGPYVRSPLLCVDVRHLGAAIGREPADGGAVSSIDAEFVVFAVGMTPTPEHGESVAGHVDAVRDALSGWDTGRSWAPS